MRIEWAEHGVKLGQSLFLLHRHLRRAPLLVRSGPVVELVKELDQATALAVVCPKDLGEPALTLACEPEMGDASVLQGAFSLDQAGFLALPTSSVTVLWASSSRSTSSLTVELSLPSGAPLIINRSWWR